jgi:hypothetical protein
MQFDTKIAVVLDQQLAGWQKANVSAFLISGISGTDPALVGEPYIDGSGKSLPAAVPPADRDLFATPHDQANRAAVATVPAAELDFAGIALHADRKTVDKVLDGLRPHP